MQWVWVLVAIGVAAVETGSDDDELFAQLPLYHNIQPGFLISSTSVLPLRQLLHPTFPDRYNALPHTWMFVNVGHLFSNTPRAVVRAMSMTRGVTVERDGYVYGDGLRGRQVSPPVPERHGDAPWHLYRLQHRGQMAVRSFGDDVDAGKVYEYIDRRPRLVTTVYVMDSGISCSLQGVWSNCACGPDKDFAKDGIRSVLMENSRAIYDDCDVNGHGTQIASLIAGKRVGIARQVSVVSIRVLDSELKGLASNVLDGLARIVSQEKTGTRRRRAVTLFAASPSPNTQIAALDLAFSELAESPIPSRETGFITPVVTSAGNHAQDVCTGNSPGSSRNVFVAAAIDISDTFWQSSGRGSCVTTLAPGVNVLTIRPSARAIEIALKGIPNAYNRDREGEEVAVTGTSAAAALLAGVTTYYMSSLGYNFWQPHNIAYWLRKVADCRPHREGASGDAGSVITDLPHDTTPCVLHLPTTISMYDADPKYEGYARGTKRGPQGSPTRGRHWRAGARMGDQPWRYALGLPPDDTTDDQGGQIDGDGGREDEGGDDDDHGHVRGGPSSSRSINPDFTDEGPSNAQGRSWMTVSGDGDEDDDQDFHQPSDQQSQSQSHSRNLHKRPRGRPARTSYTRNGQGVSFARTASTPSDIIWGMLDRGLPKEDVGQSDSDSD
ncbi:hypothetical protein PYCC9005_005736 [Savitreella phatthalungensis]